MSLIPQEFLIKTRLQDYLSIDENKIQMFQVEKQLSGLRRVDEIQATELGKRMLALMESGAKDDTPSAVFTSLPRLAPPAPSPTTAAGPPGDSHKKHKTKPPKPFISPGTQDAVQNMLEQKQLKQKMRKSELLAGKSQDSLSKLGRGIPGISSSAIKQRSGPYSLSNRQMRHMYIADCIKKKKWIFPTSKPADASHQVQYPGGFMPPGAVQMAVSKRSTSVKATSIQSQPLHRPQHQPQPQSQPALPGLNQLTLNMALPGLNPQMMAQLQNELQAGMTKMPAQMAAQYGMQPAGYPGYSMPMNPSMMYQPMFVTPEQFLQLQQSQMLNYAYPQMQVPLGAYSQPGASGQPGKPATTPYFQHGMQMMTALPQPPEKGKQ